MKAYKGFNADLTCRGFRYEVGKTYTTDKAELYKCGFHACKEMVYVFDYYPWKYEQTRYCEVELGGRINIGIDYGMCATEITIIRELSPEEVSQACGGIAVVRMSGRKYNIINSEGVLISDTGFDIAWKPRDGISLVLLNGKFNFANSGGILSPVWFDDAGEFRNGRAEVKINDNHNIINTDGNPIFGTRFDQAWKYGETFVEVERRGKRNLADMDGKVISRSWFDAIYPTCGGLAHVKRGRGENIIGMDGKPILDTWPEHIGVFIGGVAAADIDGNVKYIAAPHGRTRNFLYCSRDSALRAYRKMCR